MIGTLRLSDSLDAVLNEDGSWECAHEGFRDELNLLHRPKAQSPDIFAPFGVYAVSRAAAAYGVPYELAETPDLPGDLILPVRDGSPDDLAGLREELARQEASGEISPEDAAEAKRLLEGAASESLAASTKRFRTYLWRRKAHPRGRERSAPGAAGW